MSPKATQKKFEPYTEAIQSMTNEQPFITTPDGRTYALLAKNPE